MTRKILKSTERGQITLPKKWRSHFSTDNFVVEMYAHKLVITPLSLDDEGFAEEVIFDANRDNEGKGLSPDEFIRLLDEARHG